MTSFPNCLQHPLSANPGKVQYVNCGDIEVEDNMTSRDQEENTPLLGSDNEQSSSLSYPPIVNNFPEDPDYSQIIKKAVNAIEHGIPPERIYQGSSGSYFMNDLEHNKIGVFKPKDEEPYGHLNPKWTKWVHKLCCPCCFGRSCLVPNQGYLSEAGASLVDERLGLHIVPKTKVVRLMSDSFNYTRVDRVKARTKQHVASRFPEIGRHFHRLGLPVKIGSFQQFVANCHDADYWLKRFHDESLPKATEDAFQVEFEKLVILDYVIRNTDRGNDNWLIRYEHSDLKDDLEQADPDDWGMVGMPRIQVFAIDNGLAFPFKHPDQWRAYPFHWAWLPMASRPFSDTTKQSMLPLLSDPYFVTSLIQDLHNLFRQDAGFDADYFEKQMSVVRGQIINLVAALRDSKTPQDLVHMPVLTLEKHRRRRRWPHQRLAAGIARRHDATAGHSEATFVSTRPPSGVERTTPSGPGQAQLIAVPLVPTPLMTELRTDELDAGDLGAAELSDSAFDESLEQGLVALPRSSQPNRFSRPLSTAEADGDLLGLDDEANEFGDSEEQFKLQYCRKPFFKRF